jgi:hypothetical protein
MFSPNAQHADGNQTDNKKLSTLIMFAACPETIVSVIILSAVHDTADFVSLIRPARASSRTGER